MSDERCCECTGIMNFTCTRLGLIHSSYHTVKGPVPSPCNKNHIERMSACITRLVICTDCYKLLKNPRCRFCDKRFYAHTLQMVFCNRRCKDDWYLKVGREKNIVLNKSRISCWTRVNQYDEQ